MFYYCWTHPFVCAASLIVMVLFSFGILGVIMFASALCSIYEFIIFICGRRSASEWWAEFIQIGQRNSVNSINLRRNHSNTFNYFNFNFEHIQELKHFILNFNKSNITLPETDETALVLWRTYALHIQETLGCCHNKIDIWVWPKCHEAQMSFWITSTKDQIKNNENCRWVIVIILITLNKSKRKRNQQLLWIRKHLVLDKCLDKNKFSIKKKR